MIRFHPDALAELRAAIAWYDAEGARAGSELAAAVDERLERIERLPASAPPYRHAQGVTDLRRMAVGEWPYGIIYRARGGDIDVVVIAHEKREPGYWHERLARPRDP